MFCHSCISCSFVFVCSLSWCPLALHGAAEALAEEPRESLELPSQVPRTGRTPFAVRAQRLLQAEEPPPPALSLRGAAARPPAEPFRTSPHLLFVCLLLCSCLPVDQKPIVRKLACSFLGPLRRPPSGSARGRSPLPGPMARRRRSLRALWGRPPDHAPRVPASDHAQRLPDALGLNPHPEAGRAAPDLHRDPHSSCSIAFLLSGFLSDLARSIQAGGGGTTSPVRAMFRAREKMARSGHEVQS